MDSYTTQCISLSVSLSLCSPDEFDGEPQVGDAAGAVLLHQDVLAFEVTVGDGRLALRAEDLGVQVAQA